MILIALFLVTLFPTPGAGQLGGGLPSGGGLPVPDAKQPSVPDVAKPPVPTGLPAGLPNASLPGLDFDICQVFKVAPGPLGKGLIEGACSMAKNWQKGLQDAVKNPRDYRNILTPKQQKYWDYVVGCKSEQCICEYWPKCRKLGIDVTKVDIKKSANEATIDAVTRYGKSTRKEIRALTPVERRRFFYALNMLKFTKIDGWSKYDILTAYHFFIPFAPTAHFTAGLLPFHRELLKNFEVALRLEHPHASFPYWDSTLDAALPNPRDSVLWSNELIGNGDNVTNGPFGDWTGEANKAFPAPLHQGGIFRAVGVGQKGGLMNKEYLPIILGKKTVSELAFCRDPFFDTVHAAVHIFVGGLMADPATSASDPLFYLHHGFIDYIWEQWRQKNQYPDQRESDFAMPCPYNPFDLPDLQLAPFKIKLKEGYSNVYTDEFYSYQAQPSCENDCHKSPYLACVPKQNRCVSKIKEGGDCSDLSDVDACYNSKCKESKCVK